MPPTASSRSSVLKGAWRPTKIMNMRDLSRDDDFLSHLLVEKLGTGGFPLVVHKMDPSRRLPKTDPEELMQIVRRLVVSKGPSQTAIRQAVDYLLSLKAVRYYVQAYTQKQINAFATHASRYFELYLPSGSIEIAHTSRYSHRTGKSELCILATRPLVVGQVISELKGSMADLTEEEDKELKGTDVGQAAGVGIRRDFSVIHSKQLKKNHLFLGPARFVNHDCDHNVELFREGRYITFRVLKPIGVGEEVTAHYGDGYFGRNNRHCLCHTCEVNKRGGYAPQNDDEVSDSGSSPNSSSSDNDSDWSTDREDAPAQANVNVNERRTRRGVYAVLPDEEEDPADESDADVEPEPDATSDLISAPRSASADPALAGPSKHTGLLTPDTETLVAESCSASAVSTPRKATPATSFSISTRAQKARAASELESISAALSGKDKGKARATVSRSASAVRQLETPPLTSDNGSVADGPSLRSSSRLRARGDAASSVSRVSTPMYDRKGKGPASTLDSTTDALDLKGKAKEDPEMEGRSLRKRPVVPAPIDLSAAVKKPQDGPRGVDGKLLPTCMTCKNVLPVISVEDKVVWNGLPEKTGKRGRPRKQVNQECPRCMRHHAIYGNLAALNKLSNAASGSRAASTTEKRPYKRQRTVEPEEAPSPKRPKVEPSSSHHNRGRGRPPKNKVGMSNEARKLLGVRERRSSRTRIPSAKMRASEPPPKGKGSSVNGSSNAPVSTASASSDPPHEDPSPSSSSPPQTPTKERHLRSTGELSSVPTTPVVVKTEGGPKLPTPKSLAVASQPREANGRFGKKATTNGRFMRKNFHFTAGGRRTMRAKRSKPHSKTGDNARGDGRDARGEHEDDLGSDGRYSSHKRSLDEQDEVDAERGKRRRLESEEPRVKIEGEETDLFSVMNENDEGTASQDECEESLFRRPSLAAGKSGMGLFARPNPLTFARRKWTSSVPPEGTPELQDPEEPHAGQSLSTDDDTDPPVTPEDGEEQPAAVADERYGDEDTAEQEDDHEIDSDDATLFKPNPLNMARLRWAPTPASGHPEPEPEDYADLSLSKTSSRTSLASLGDLFEAEPDDVSLDADRPAHGSIDADASSEEVS
ncbi:hypothetical protein C8Q74DRAFT_1316171 [Fomes fomentarius]|nr:hypothetical protein C8Q74DRAFT_1316171 [Fomes fomentarius]